MNRVILGTIAALLLAGTASAETVPERMQEHFTAAMRYCLNLPLQYARACMDDYEVEYKLAAHGIFQVPDVDRLNATFTSCATNRVVEDAVNLRPHRAMSVVIECVGITYAIGSPK